MEYSAGFRFYESLNDFLSAGNKNSIITYQFNGSPSIKDAIEAIGIPHTEVDTIFVNGSPVDFPYKLNNKDQADVYPLENIANVTATSLSPTHVSPVCFIADVHAGKLSKGLRMLGFDTIYQNNFTGYQLAEIAEKENRVVVTRNIGLLKHKKIKWGYWLRSQEVNEQLEEVINRYNLKKDIKPFVRCIACNGKIEPVKKEEIQQQLPPQT